MAPEDPHRVHTSTPEELTALNAMASSGRAFMAWRDGAGALQLLQLDASAPRTTIGRSPTSSISLGWDTAVSKLHAEIACVDEEWLIVDDGSMNGTFVAGRRVHGRSRVRDEDRIVVGVTVLVFHDRREAPLGTTSALRAVARTDLKQNEYRVLKALCRPMVLERRQQPASNDTIMGEVFMSLDGVKGCLTRLYTAYDFPPKATQKRAKLAQQAVNSGLIGRHSYN